MGQRRLGGWNRRVLVGFLAVAAMGTALLAPLARSSGQAGAVTIDGARSLADKVSVQFQKAQGRTTDVHLLAWNDFHGNLEAGPASTSTASSPAAPPGWPRRCEDKQAQYGDKRDQRHRRRQHRRQPARRRPVLRRALDDRHQPDERRLRVGRQPRVRQGHDRAAADPERRLPRGRRLHGGALRARRTAAPPTPTPAPTSSTCRPTSCATTTGKTLFPAYGTKRIKSDSGKKFEIGIIGEVLEATPTIVTPTGVAGLTFQDEADAANAVVKQLQKQGREHERARDPPGRLPDGHGRR